MFLKGKRSSNIVGSDGNTNVAEFELRPGGMFVQKRNSNTNHDSNASASTIRVRVKYGSSYHEIHISSHASFGELKKMLTEPTGLHAEEQKLIFKKKERDSKSYLDVERVKNGSKLVLIEDIQSKERRMLEKLKIANKEKTSKSLTEINLEVDKLAKKVAALEAAASTGAVIEELDIENLTNNFMRILITLDAICCEGELKLQIREQVRRVQKHIETLDMLKMSKPNSLPMKKENNMPMERKVLSGVQRKGNWATEGILKKQDQLKRSTPVVTTKWETFD